MAMEPTPPLAPVTRMGPMLRALAIDLHAMDGEGGGESGGAKDHGATGIQPRRYGHQPVPRAAEVLAIAPVMVEGEPPAGGENRVALPVAGVPDASTTPAPSIPPTREKS
jgi:hypothetical protein